MNPEHAITLRATFIEPAGWMLVHSLWQVTCLAAGVALITRLFPRRSPEFRYVVSGFALVAMVVLAAATFWVAIPPVDAEPVLVQSIGQTSVPPIDDTGGEIPLGRSNAEFDEAERSELESYGAPLPPFDNRPEARLVAPTQFLRTIFPWFVGAWTVGVLILSIWNVGGWIAIQRLVKLGIRPVGADVRHTVQVLSNRLQVARAVRILQSAVVDAPSVVGWLKPTILLPGYALTGLTPDQLEAILAHELAHIRRGDYLANLLQTVAETLLFYHPGVWYVSRRMRIEREYCADKLAAGVCGSATSYAEALATLEESAASLGGFAVAATGGNLLGRVKRVLGLATHDGGRTGSWLIGAAASLAILLGLVGIPTAYAAFAQSEVPTVNMRRVWADHATGPDGRISPDGRLIAYINWGNGNLAVHDLETEESRELITGGGWEPPARWAEYPLWSPDSRHIAYAWYVGAKQDLRVVSIDGGEPRVVVEGDNDVTFAYPLDWMPNGKQVLAGVGVGENRGYQALIDVADGSIHRLPDSPHSWDTASISPDGKYIAYDRHGEGAEREIYLFDMATGESNPLVLHPADDRYPNFSRDGKWLTFISTRGGQRVPWMIPFADGRPAGEPRRLAPGLTVGWPMGLTDRGVYATSVNARQNNIYQVAYDPDSDTVSGKPHLLVQRFEGANYMPTWSPDGSKLAFISSRPVPGGGSRRIVVVRDEATGEEAYPPIRGGISPIRSHLAWRWDNKTLLIRMISRGQDPESPSMQRLLAWDFDTGHLTPLAEWPIRTVNNISYAFAVSPDDMHVYYTAGDRENTIRIVQRRLSDGNERDIAMIPSTHLATELAVSPDGKRLTVLDSSAFRFVDLTTGGDEVVVDLAGADFEPFGSSTTWTAAGDYLLFAHRTPGNPPRTTLMRIPATGGAPQPAGLTMAHIRRLAIHPTGRQLAFDGGPSPHTNEVWLVENSLLMLEDP